MRLKLKKKEEGGSRGIIIGNDGELKIAADHTLPINYGTLRVQIYC